MNKIVILGSSGLLGLNLCLILKKKYKVYPIVNKKKIQIKNLKSQYLNLGKKAQIEKYLKKVKPQFLINCVALSDVEKCEKEKKMTFQINSKLAIDIAKICKKKSIHYTFISSDHLYSGKKKFYVESDKVKPLNNYAKSKVLAEKGIMKNCNDFLILRTNFFGFGPKFRNSLLDRIFNNFISSKEVNLLCDAYYSPIFINQLIYIIDILLEKKIKGIYNITGNTRLTKYQFGKKILNKFNFDKKLLKKLYLKETNSKVIRPKDMSLSNKKIKKIVANNSLFDLTKGISQLYNIYNSNYFRILKSIK